MAQSDIFMGSAKIYTGCTVPAVDTAITLAAGVPASGTDIGLTAEGAVFKRSQEIYSVMVEQALVRLTPEPPVKK